MTNSTDFTAAAGQARAATEKTVEAYKNGAQAFSRQLDAVKLPELDMTQPVTRYFEFLQKAIDVNRDLAIQWAEMFTNLSSSVREQAQQVGGIVKDQAENVANLTTRQAETAEQAAKEQAEQVEQAERQRAEEAEEAQKAKAREAKRVEREEARKAEEAEEAEKAKAREAKRAEREEARKAQQQAREAYEGLSKAELSDQLAGRGLPKTGNIDDLIERLVTADSE